jgi:hypothetical protein
MGFTPPLSHFSFSNWVATPDGKWGLFTENPIQMRPRYHEYGNTYWFAMKLPPSPNVASQPRDDIDRTAFVTRPVTVGAGSGAFFRVVFGYMENEPAGSTSIHFYGTTRQETTSTALFGSDPFAFASDAATCQASPGSAKIPAIPGRLTYYAIQRFSDSGCSTLLGTGPVSVLAVR